MKKLWKISFPVNGSNVFAKNSANSASIEKLGGAVGASEKQTLLSEIKSIKNELETKNEKTLAPKKVDSGAKNKANAENDIFANTKIDDGLVLMSELLRTLKKNMDFTVLMTCRKIKSISIEGNVAVIDYDDESVKNLVTNEKYYAVMQEFFKQKGLSFKLKEKSVQENPKDKLNKLLGGKLQFGYLNKDLYL